MAEKLTALFNWMHGRESRLSKKMSGIASIIHLYRQKRYLNVCDNHRGMYLFIASCWGDAVKSLLNEWNSSIKLDFYFKMPWQLQEGKRNNKHDLTAHHLQDKCQEQNVNLYTWPLSTSPNHSTQSGGMHFWKIMQSFVFHVSLMAVVRRQFHDGKLALVEMIKDG